MEKKKKTDNNKNSKRILNNKNSKRILNNKKVNSKGTKKETIKKKEVDKNKDIVKNKRDELQTKENFFTSIKFLRVVFYLLLLVVLILGVLVYRASLKYKKDTHADIVIPVMKSGDDFAFNINAYQLSKSDEYVFKITNYNNKEINSSKTAYQINVMNSTDSVISIVKNSSERNLMTEQKSTIIKEVIESENKKDVFFHVKMKKNGKLKKKDLIAIKIES